jgi:hypothetical protein
VGVERCLLFPDFNEDAGVVGEYKEKSAGCHYDRRQQDDIECKEA